MVAQRLILACLAVAALSGCVSAGRRGLHQTTAVAAKVVAAVKPVCAGVAPAGLQACLNKAAIEMQKASGMKVTCADREASKQTACIASWVAGQQAKMMKEKKATTDCTKVAAPKAKQDCVNAWIVKNYAAYKAAAKPVGELDDLFSGTEPIDNFFDDEEKANITARGKANVTGDDLGDLFSETEPIDNFFDEEEKANVTAKAESELGDLFSETEPIDNFFDDEEKANVTKKAENDLGDLFADTEPLDNFLTPEEKQAKLDAELNDLGDLFNSTDIEPISNFFDDVEKANVTANGTLKANTTNTTVKAVTVSATPAFKLVG